MTEAQVERILDVWITRLKLQNWEIKWVDLWEIPEKLKFDDQEFAFVWRTKDYYNAMICLAPDWPTWDSRKANVTVVHELLHLFTRGVEKVLDDLDELLAPAVENLIISNHRHEVEGAVDNLAICLVDLVGEA